MSDGAQVQQPQTASDSSMTQLESSLSDAAAVSAAIASEEAPSDVAAAPAGEEAVSAPALAATEMTTTEADPTETTSVPVLSSDDVPPVTAAASAPESAQLASAPSAEKAAVVPEAADDQVMSSIEQVVVKTEDSKPTVVAAAPPSAPAAPIGRPSAASVNAIFAPAAKKPAIRSTDPRLATTSAAATDLIGEMRAKLALEPRDADAWIQLLQEVHQRADSGAAGSAEDALKALEDAYEEFFKVFPNAGAQWVKYGQLQLSYDRSAEVESIFTRSLRTTPDVELWRFYLSYTRRVNPLPPATAKGAGQQEAETPRERTRKLLEGAYEFALRFIGTDVQAGPIWTEYLQLLKEREVGTPWQEGQKMDDLRRTYQRAVTIPLANVEQIWREYDAYENGLNRVTAKKFLAERSPAYMTARSAVREQRILTEKLSIPTLPNLPCWAPSPVNCNQEGVAVKPQQSVVEAERAQVAQWLKYIDWEKKNPLELEDPSLVHARVLVAFRKATANARFFPEIWFMASEYCREVGDAAEAVQWMRSGMQACPGSFLLHFAFVDHCEASKEYAECAPIFEALLSHVNERILRRLAARDEVLAKLDAEGAAERERLLAAKADEGAAADELLGDEKEGQRKDVLARQARKEEVQKIADEEMQNMREEAAVVWIKQMQFERRTQGLKAMRTVFGRARKSAHCAWPVYEASAMLEYHCSKDANVATKVFELALKTFPSSSPLVERYLDFLISINDENNARALFERTIGTFTPEAAQSIWRRWLEYTYDYGDLVAAQRLEVRLKTVYPDVAPTLRFAQKSRYKSLDVVSTVDLGILPPSAMRTDIPPAANGQNVAVPTGPRANDDTAAGQPLAKRPRVGQSPAPSPTVAPRIPLGPKGGDKGAVKAVVEHHAPRPPVPMPPAPRPAPPPNLPDRLLWLLSLIPPSRIYQGPKISPEGIFECLAHANLHAVGPAGMQGPPGSYGGHAMGGGIPAGPSGMYGGGGGYGQQQQQHGMNGMGGGGYGGPGGGRKRKW